MIFQSKKWVESIEKTLSKDEKKYFGLKFDTWFFAKERKSDLKDFFERAETLLSDILGDKRIRAVLGAEPGK